MDHQTYLHELEKNVSIIRQLCSDLSDGQARVKPQGNTWSILEVINHLADEEKDDFRIRLDITLHDPDGEWPPIDPPGWARDRQYNQRSLGESLQRFERERRYSMQWLKGLRDPRWESGYIHPRIGELRAGDILAAWLAHDYLHIRQLAGLRVTILQNEVAPFHTRYATP